MMVKFSSDPFDYFAPTVCIGAIIMIPLGPLFLPRCWILFLFCYFFIFLGTQLSHLIQFWYTASHIKRTIRQSKSLNTYDMEPMVFKHDFVHAIVIPNYSEPEALIRDTIQYISVHRKARTHYVIILAMEASELHYRTKSENLKERFKDNFLEFIVTCHPSDLPGEARGKGSNISYASRKGCAKLIENGIDPQRIIITIADSDSHISELYITELEKSFNLNEEPYHKIFAPPTFFSRNSFKVPASVRVTDIVWSSMVMSNISNSFGIGFPCSTYSISFVLADKVGYWDTDADAIGEDMHMLLKCFFKTEGRTHIVPIYVPINLLNVETKGYFDNLVARFVQSKRHHSGVADVAYTLRNTFNLSTDASILNEQESNYFWVKKMWIIFKVFEAHFIPVTSGWLMFLAVPMMKYMIESPESFITRENILHSNFYSCIWDILKNVTIFLPFPLFGTLLIYENLHRFIDLEFLNKTKEETRQWYNYFDYFHTPIAAWFFMTIPASISSFKRLFKGRDQYIVAEKVFNEE